MQFFLSCSASVDKFSWKHAKTASYDRFNKCQHPFHFKCLATGRCALADSSIFDRSADALCESCLTPRGDGEVYISATKAVAVRTQDGSSEQLDYKLEISI